MNELYRQQVQQNPMNGFLQRFQQFRQGMTKDPKEQIQQLMNSGKVSQAQYNGAYQLANQLMRMFSGK